MNHPSSKSPDLSLITTESTYAHPSGADKVYIGHDAIIEDCVSLGGIGGRFRRVFFGNNACFGGVTKIRGQELHIGDYIHIKNHTLIYGHRPVNGEHEGWFGQNIVLNSTERLRISNSCCVGENSQLWAHFQFGNVMEGCRFNSAAPMTLQSDVWISCHCEVSPVLAEELLMALPSSTVTGPMQHNQVYADNPARDVTERVGPQFLTVAVANKVPFIQEHIADLHASQPHHEKGETGGGAHEYTAQQDRNMYDTGSHTYAKYGAEAEFAFMPF